jgi:transcription elongation factor Elf1
MSPKVNNPGNRCQVFEAQTGDRTQTQYEQYTHCPKCNRFGIVSGRLEYYGTIYHCACQDVSWVISPETGEKLEGG